MSRPAPLSPPMDEQLSPPDTRRAYEEILVRAMRQAERLVPRDQAYEVAHDVAVELMARPASDLTGALLYLRVTSRVRNLWRSRDRREAVDRAYFDMRSTAAPAWAQPGSDLEARELRDRIRDVVAGMPDMMRQAFLLVREHELTYKQTAARLGIGVATVHTHLSRANVLLRECVKQYEAGAAPAGSPGGRRP